MIGMNFRMKPEQDGLSLANTAPDGGWRRFGHVHVTSKHIDVLNITYLETRPAMIKCGKPDASVINNLRDGGSAKGQIIFISQVRQRADCRDIPEGKLS
jgi:hypothetical protein